MDEQDREEFQPEDIPEAVVQSRFSQLSIVWIIPLVAALIGAWLIYKAQSEKGPTITITFQTAEGLEAGIIGVNDPVPTAVQCLFGG